MSRALMISCTALLLGMCICCSNPKVLKFFFDGVPEPEIKKQDSNDTPLPKMRIQLQNIKPTVNSEHPDYISKACSKCHDIKAETYLNTDVRRLCFNCHKESAFTGAYVHGPIAVGECLKCHLPHESQYDFLLKNTGSALCYICHKQDDVLLNDKHIIENIDSCSDCHSSHVSEDRYLIKRLN
ncbi:MAG: cytochrome c3 family protein [Candidatus Aminicenantes bacterium]|nr:cytochrome c3 family protein [Candidatus Aminicenantes bacterium]